MQRHIDIMEKQIQLKDPLLRANNLMTFELLTREEADKEMQVAKDQVKTYKEALRQRDQLVKEKDDEIKELKEQCW